MNEMLVGDLFAGIGGFSLGLEWAGMKIAWQVENDPFCLKLLNKHWPEVPKYGDIKELNAENLTKVDVITGGFPCQPFSAAGKRGGAGDDRYLWPEMLRIIRGVRPTWIIGENVAGVVRLALDQVLSDLEEEGYSTQAFIIPACGLGAPHRRERVWIVGNAGGQRRQQESRSSHGDESADEGRGAQGADQFTSASQNVADTRRNTPRASKEFQRQESKWKQGGIDFTNSGQDGGWGWPVEPNVGRVANGVPNRVDRLKSLGNAVVPQIPYVIGNYIMEIEQEQGG